MRASKSAIVVLVVLITAFARGPKCLAQATPQKVPIVVPAGVPLHVALDKSVLIKRPGVPVQAHVVDPIYVYDRLVIPAGSQVEGRVTKVEGPTRKQRGLAIADGNFSPLRTAQVDFQTLVLKDGTHLVLQTSVTQGAPRMVHLEAGEQGKKKGRVSQGVAQAKQQALAREQAALSEIKSPGKLQRMKAWVWAQFPYHKSRLAAGTHFTAELKAPLEVGSEDPSATPVVLMGAEFPPGSEVRVRLLTPLSSKTDHQGSPVEAIASQPVFSPNHDLLLPQGAQLHGVVTQVVPARRLHRNGQLRFTFRVIDMGSETVPRPVYATIQAVDAPSDAHVKLDEEGGAHTVNPKTRFIAPAIDVVLALGSLDGLDPHNRKRIEEGLGPQGPDVAGGAIRGEAGFGLVGTVVGLAAHYRPVSACFAFYGAGWSVYTHILARGNNVVFPKNTSMDIRFGTHGEHKLPAGK